MLPDRVSNPGPLTYEHFLCTPFISVSVCSLKPPMLLIIDAMALLFCTREATLFDW